MRRPTNDLVDAVGTSERTQSVTEIKIMENVESKSSSEKGGLRTVVIKKEDIDGRISSWKIPSSEELQTQGHKSKEEGSPLADKIATATPSTELPASITLDRRRRTVGVQSGEDESGEKNSHPSGTKPSIASLAARNQPFTKKTPDNKPTKDKALNEEEEAIPQPNENHLPEDSTNPQDTHPPPSKPTTTTTRHHPTIPPDEPKPTAAANREAAMARARERKRELRLSAALHDRTKPDVTSARSTAGLQDDEAVQGRGDRVAVRRRSMML